MKAGTRPEEIAKARESVKQLEESLTFAKNDLERITRLVENGALPGEQKEKARVEYVSVQTRLQAAKEHLEMLESGYTKTALAVQKALVDEASARLEVAKARLAECTICAPFSGIITRVYIRVSDMAAAKVPLLELIDTSWLAIRTAVPEASAVRIKRGMKAKVSLDAYPNKIFLGRVERIYPDVDQKLRTRTVEISLTDKVSLIPGMFARIELQIDFVKDALVIPEESILITPKGEMVVFIIDGSKATRRKVTTGIRHKGEVQIITGINRGEKVVIAGSENLKDGQEVRLAGKEKSGEKMEQNKDNKHQSKNKPT
ncbi:MAG: efflux RND transporter periplasmic adaptor subunit [Candidatus Omnitrophica bacterium]|nr:efflux RND transporter periplasmic adaptor subunit [Candidatus Omnitrophota bacterium]